MQVAVQHRYLLLIVEQAPRRIGRACEDAAPMKNHPHTHAASAARMASGMTSRARRPESCI